MPAPLWVLAQIGIDATPLLDDLAAGFPPPRRARGTTTMPRTREQLQQAAADAERWLDSPGPAAIALPDADASRLRRIGAAVRAAATSQVELADAVADAREHGHTWTQIAAMLGTSRQAARERYGEPAERP